MGEDSIYTAKMALAVSIFEPLKFKIIHKALMIMPINKEVIENLLAAESIDFVKISDEADKIEIKNAISEHFKLAENLRIHKLPAYRINGNIMTDILDTAKLKQVIAEVRNHNSKE